MTRAAWEALLAETRAAWTANQPVSQFCPFPDDIVAQDLTPRPLPAAALFAAETGLSGESFPALRDASRAAGAEALWRDTYADTAISRDFRDRFGCFTLIGDGGPFTSDRARAWFVYMPARLYYPWHHHKADEAYLVLDGSAVFRRAGKADATFGEGAVLMHEPLEPHAMETFRDPVLALVIWRSDFDQKPVLTYEDAR